MAIFLLELSQTAWPRPWRQVVGSWPYQGTPNALFRLSGRPSGRPLHGKTVHIPRFRIQVMFQVMRHSEVSDTVFLPAATITRGPLDPSSNPSSDTWCGPRHGGSRQRSLNLRDARGLVERTLLVSSSLLSCRSLQVPALVPPTPSDVDHQAELCLSTVPLLSFTSVSAMYFQQAERLAGASLDSAVVGGVTHLQAVPSNPSVSTGFDKSTIHI